MTISEQQSNLFIDSVTDKLQPPVIETSLLQRTRDQYALMYSDERQDFWKAATATLGGVGLTAAAYAVERATRDSSSKLAKAAPTVMRASAYALDSVDGYFAKRLISATSSGAVTELGCVADPLADKVNNLVNEISLVQSDEMNVFHPVVRVSRDIAVSGFRRHVMKSSGGRIDVRANKFGKFNTLARDSANLLASTAVMKRRKTLNTAVQTSVDMYSLASGFYTIFDLYKKSR